MRLGKFIVPFFLFFSLFGFTQSNDEKETLLLQNTVDLFLQKSDFYRADRKQEYIVMILEVDSLGTVKNIHLLCDNDNIDSSYTILRRMKPTDFNGKVFNVWKNKTITLPIYSLSGKMNYVEYSVVHPKNTIETRKSVLVKPLYYASPGRRIEESLPNRIMSVDSLKNRN